MVAWQWHWSVFNKRRKICRCCKIYQEFEEQGLKAYDNNIKNVYIDKLDEIVD